MKQLLFRKYVTVGFSGLLAVVVMRLISEPVARQSRRLEFFVLEPVLILLHILCGNVGADHPLSVLYQHDGDQLVFGRGSVCVCNWYRTCHSTGQSNDRGQILSDQHFVVSVSTVGRNRMVGVWVRVICRPEDGMSGRILQTTPSRFATAPPAGANSRPRWRGCRV